MTIRLLQQSDFEQLYQTFKSAFANNAVPFQPTKADFEYRLTRKIQMNPEISAGIFDGEEMLGFIMHASNIYEGVPTAYNGGTGVLPGFRNQRFADQIYGFLIPKIQSMFLARVLLEVVETNEKAIALYEKLGFVQRRRFKCYKQTKTMDPDPSFSVIEGSIPEVDFSYNDFHPSFIDSNEHLKRGNEKVLLAKDEGNKLQGYLIMQPHLGRISQVAVSRFYRHKKIGEQLIRSAQAFTEKPLTIMNIPEEEEGFDAFLSHCGFQNQVNQFEMELII